MFAGNIYNSDDSNEYTHIQNNMIFDFVDTCGMMIIAVSLSLKILKAIYVCFK